MCCQLSSSRTETEPAKPFTDINPQHRTVTHFENVAAKLTGIYLEPQKDNILLFPPLISTVQDILNIFDI